MEHKIMRTLQWVARRK